MLTILDKINEKTPPPPPLPQNQGWGKWRVLAFARLSSLIWRGRRFTAPFYFVQECRWERAQSASVVGIRGKRKKGLPVASHFLPFPSLLSPSLSLIIGHFRVVPSLCFKARLTAKPLIFTRNVLH